MVKTVACDFKCKIIVGKGTNFIFKKCLDLRLSKLLKPYDPVIYLTASRLLY